ncbi:MAG: hypothetical protein LBD38_01370 [Streptococcaceae bacterium]|nr:hypothetical protein [Streptococcaceae bacterium]
MKKIFLLAGLFILFGCTSRLEAGYTVILKNACDYPINVSSPKYIEYVVSEGYLNPNEAIVVVAVDCTDASKFFTIRTSSWASGVMCLPDDYRLTITADDKERILDKQQLLNTLKKADYKSERFRFKWTISDPSLCPK